MQKLDPVHIPGTEMLIFANPEIEDKAILKVRLLNYIETSDSFVLDDNELSKDLNKVYCLELWEADILEYYTSERPVRPIVGNKGIVKLRVLYTVGQRALYSSQPAEEREQSRDSFRLLPDQDISYWNSRVDDSELFSEAF